jgi:ribonucleoside-diphosphate reductase alpha chain
MDKQALSDITVFNKYAKFLPKLGRRENWSDICRRNADMHTKKYPNLAAEIEQIYADFVVTKKVLPSMRSLQFGGRPIELAPNRIYNCAYFPMEHTKCFSELMFLLLGGTGVGYSVQARHINKLPKIKAPESDQEYKFQIQDSIIGWADTIKVVSKAFFNGGTLPIFDYRDIRDKGTDLITSGGKAPGPEPLRICVEKLIPIFRQAIGRRLTSVEVHDIACIVADAVLAGGIRRAAMIALFDRTDEAMLTCKSMVKVSLVFDPKVAVGTMHRMEWTSPYGERQEAGMSAYDRDNLIQTKQVPWYIAAPHRARCNNSAVLPRGEVTSKEFTELMERVEASGCGEPGVYWTNNPDWGTNPCVEIGLKPYQMCNLTTINASQVTDQASYNAASGAAAFLGTLQAGYTDFHYLNPKWKLTCEEDALLGVSMTGIASGNLNGLDMTEAAQYAVAMNKDVAKVLGINPAARVTCVKPEGTSSLVLGTSSGIHAWHAPYYIRRMRASKDEALAEYMSRAVPGLVEQDVTNPNQVILSFPQKAPQDAVCRDESVFDLLDRVLTVATHWVTPGHVTGDNSHNVSCTISVKDGEWKKLTKWMWTHRESYNGIAVLPYFGSTAYPQMPFEDITEAEYLEILPLLKGIDISKVFENNGNGVNLMAELACSAGACELAY